MLSPHSESSYDELLTTDKLPHIGGKSGKYTAVFNLLCTIMGGSILSLSWAISQSGLLLGTLIVALLATYFSYTLELLFACGRITRNRWITQESDGSIFTGDQKLAGEYTFYKTDQLNIPVFVSAGERKNRVFLHYMGDYEKPDEWNIVEHDPIQFLRYPDNQILARVQGETIPQVVKSMNSNIRVKVTPGKRRIMTFSRVGKEAYGKPGKWACILTVGLLSYFIVVVYFLFLAGVIPDIIRFFTGVKEHGDDDFWTSRPFAMAIVFLAALPCSSVIKINTLKYPSLVAICCLFIVSVIIIFEGIMAILNDETQGGPIEYFHLDWHLLRTVSISSSAYICHINAFTQFTELKDLNNTRNIAHSTFGIAAIFYLLVGTFGYIQFRSATLGNILENYDGGDYIAFIARCCLTWKLLVGVALYTFAARRNVVTLIWGYKLLARSTEIIVTFVILGSAYGLAMLLGDVVELLLALVGASLGAIIALIFPTLFYNKLRSGRALNFRTRDTARSSLIFLFSVALSLVCSSVSIIDFAIEYGLISE